MALTKITTGEITDGTITSADIATGTITSADMAVDPTNATNLTSGAVAVGQLTTIPGANITGTIPLAALSNAPATDLTSLEDDIALLGFKIAANGSLAKYNLDDQTVDAFEDATGIDASASTNEVRNASNYYSGTSVLDAYTSLYIMSGANGNTTFVDGSATPYTLTRVGDLVHSSADYKFAPTSVYSDGTGDYLTVVSPAANLDFSTGDFTFDCWIKITGALETWDGLIEIGKHNVGAAGYGIWWNSDGMIRTHFGATTVDSANGAITTGSWQHIASVRNGTAYNLYVNGISVASATNSTSLAVNANGVWLLVQGANLTRTWQGYSEAYRISKGIARWTSNFTPPTSPPLAAADMTLVSNATTAESAPTKGDIVMTYTNASGTATLNTDLTAEFSADNGSTWTSTTLVAQGSTGTHLIVSAHDVTRTSTSGTAMKYRIKTLNQDGSKETRIQAVSLGWS